MVNLPWTSRQWMKDVSRSRQERLVPDLPPGKRRVGFTPSIASCVQKAARDRLPNQYLLEDHGQPFAAAFLSHSFMKQKWVAITLKDYFSRFLRRSGDEETGFLIPWRR